MAAINEEKWMNVIDNAVLPVDIRKQTQVGGALTYVGFEVLVSYIARRVFKVSPRPITQLAAIHALSIPFLGGMSAFMEGESPQGFEAPMSDQFMEGAKGIPAVFAGTYIVNTYLQGIHAPKLDFKDILITAASKIVTRPLMSVTVPKMGDSVENGQKAIRASVALQRTQSRLSK